MPLKSGKKRDVEIKQECRELISRRTPVGPLCEESRTALCSTSPELCLYPASLEHPAPALLQGRTRTKPFTLASRRLLHRAVPAVKQKSLMTDLA